MSTDTIFQPTDLVQRRVEFLEAARRSGARLRDKDGTSLVMLRESRVQLLELLSEWNAAYLRLERLMRRGSALTVEELGDLAWLRVFDDEDRSRFLEDLGDALVAARADNNVAPLHAVVDDWRVTASQLDDPLRRSVLLDTTLPEGDLVDAARPADE